jgi:hypothetical protein
MFVDYIEVNAVCRRLVQGVWLECLVYRLWCAQKFNFILLSPIYGKINRIYTKLSNWANKDMKRLQSNTGNGAGLDKHSVFRIQGAILSLWNAKMRLALPLPPLAAPLPPSNSSAVSVRF